MYGQALVKGNADAAFSKLVELKDDTVHYVLRERELNTLGYQLLDDGYTSQSLEVFKVNALLFAKSYNVYDSYGDALARTGLREEAIRMYEKSISLNPGYQEAKNKLKELQK